MSVISFCKMVSFYLLLLYRITRSQHHLLCPTCTIFWISINGRILKIIQNENICWLHLYIWHAKWQSTCGPWETLSILSVFYSIQKYHWLLWIRCVHSLCRYILGHSNNHLFIFCSGLCSIQATHDRSWTSTPSYSAIWRWSRFSPQICA